MEKRSYYCDKCNKEVATTKDLKTITIGNGGSFDSFSSYNRFEIYKKFDLCEDCQKKVGVFIPVPSTQEQRISTADRLYEIVAEMIAESREQGS
jgi:ribosomal protein S26